MGGSLLTSSKTVSLPFLSLSLRFCLNTPLINCLQIPPQWYLMLEESISNFQSKNMQMRTALPPSSQISWASFNVAACIYVFFLESVKLQNLIAEPW